MKLHSEDFDKIARLSLLEFTPQEKEKLLKELNKLLKEAKKLDDFDLENEAPLINPAAVFHSGTLRHDSPQPPTPQKVIFRNAPKTTGSYIVPKLSDLNPEVSGKNRFT